MPKATAAKISRKRLKKKPGKRLGRGPKIFLVFLGLFFLTLLLCVVIAKIQTQMFESRVQTVDVDLEIGTSGEAPGQFQEPCGVATDGKGFFYVSEFSGHRIQKFDANGTPVWSIGKRGKEEGDFEQPSGLYVDGAGTLFVCDTFNHRIEEFDPDGKFIKAWSHSFFGPRGVVETSLGRIYVTDTGNHKVQVFDSNGQFLQEWGGMGTSNGKFREPVGITADPQGNVYVADSDNRRIQKFDPNGKFLAAFKVPTWKGKNDEVPYIAFSQGFLYASNASENDKRGAVLKLNADGKLLAIYRKKNKEGFAGAAGIALDDQNRVYVVERGSNRIARFTLPPAAPAHP